MGRHKGSKDLKQRECSKYTPVFLKKLGDKLIAWMNVPENFWLGEFAIENDMWRSQLDELSDKDSYFSESLKKAKTIQETRLVQLSLARKVDTTMAIFALKNVAGWRDNQNVVDQSQHRHTTIIWQELNGNGNGKFKNKNQITYEPMESMERLKPV